MTAGPGRRDHGQHPGVANAMGCEHGAANGTPCDRSAATDPWATTRRYPPPEFGPALVAARRRAGWSLAQLAARSGLSRGYLCRLENGRRAPSVVTVAWLVAALPLSETEVSTVIRAGLRGVGRAWQAAERNQR